MKLCGKRYFISLLTLSFPQYTSFPFFKGFPVEFSVVVHWELLKPPTMAAAFGLLHFPPSTAHFSNTHLFLPSPPPNPCLLSLSTKTQRPNLQLFVVRASAQVEAQPIVQSESAEENVVEDDGSSGARVLVQNVPWTCTADDLRPMLEKFGTVVDIEVGFLFLPPNCSSYGYHFQFGVRCADFGLLFCWV